MDCYWVEHSHFIIIGIRVVIKHGGAPQNLVTDFENSVKDLCSQVKTVRKSILPGDSESVWKAVNLAKDMSLPRLNPIRQAVGNQAHPQRKPFLLPLGLQYRCSGCRSRSGPQSQPHP